MKRYPNAPALLVPTLPRGRHVGTLEWFALILLVLNSTGSPAQDAAPAAQESRKRWQWYEELRLPDWDKPPRWLDFLVSPDVFDKARSDLGDLRLYDAQDREVPYALRIRRAQDTQEPLPAREFNRTTLPDRAAELSLDLGPMPGEHNQLVVLTDGKDFRRRLRVEASDDSPAWQVLLDKVYLVHFRVDGRLIEVHRFTYPLSRFRYLRVRVYPDTSLEADAPAIHSVVVSRVVQIPGEDVVLPAALGEREFGPADGGPGTIWQIDLGARVPCERLSFEINEEEFVRSFRLEMAITEEAGPSLTGTQWQWIQNGEWRRRAGEAHRPMEIRFPEVQARRLRLVVTDFRNPPLNVTAVRYAAPARQVVFGASDLAPPLKLYFGNPKAQSPHYDFAATLPERLDPAPLRVTLGELAANPEYRPIPLPWTERWPWLVYVVLGVASTVLLLILIALGREALRQHDLAAVAGSSSG